jgi:hypothetical protein
MVYVPGKKKARYPERIGGLMAGWARWRAGDAGSIPGWSKKFLRGDPGSIPAAGKKNESFAKP